MRLLLDGQRPLLDEIKRWVFVYPATCLVVGAMQLRKDGLVGDRGELLWTSLSALASRAHV